MDKATLLTAKTPTSPVTFPLVGEDGELTTGEVVVRGLTRGEWFNIGKIGGTDPTAENGARVEAFMLSCGLVDPQLTYDEAKTFQETAPSAVIEPILRKIRDLSGLNDNASREAYKSI